LEHDNETGKIVSETNQKLKEVEDQVGGLMDSIENSKQAMVGI
jgi:hypothetical protein